MVELINTVRPYLEAIYFLASISLVAGLGLTFRQVLLIKEDIKIKNQRAAAEKAIEACDRYLSVYVPLTKIHYENLKKNKLEPYKGPIGDFSVESVSKNKVIMKESVRRYALESWLSGMNQLESIAAYFISGVADESTGYKVIGRTYCNTIERLYDLIALSRTEKACAYWSNSVALYQLWQPRLKKDENVIKRDGLDDLISSIQDKSISPIGVSSDK